MVRTIISLEEGDKRWLDAEAAREGVSMAEVIRRAVKHMRQERERATELDALLAATRGIGSREDGLEVQRRLRNEWERHPA